MPEYRSTKMMLARAKNAADRARTAADHAAANLSPNAPAFSEVADRLAFLLAQEISVAINERALVTTGIVVPVAEAATEVATELATEEAPETLAEIAASADYSEVAELPTGEIADAEVDPALADGPAV